MITLHNLHDVLRVENGAFVKQTHNHIEHNTKVA